MSTKMINIHNIKYNVFGVSLAVFLTITVVGIGFTDSAYAHGESKVGCKDLGLALLTWDDLYGNADEDDLKEYEFGLADVDIKPVTYEDIIDEHMEELASKFYNECKKTVDVEILEKFDEDVNFNR
jgi:hypothetical protein